MIIDELISRLKEGGISHNEEDLRKLLSRAINTSKLEYIKDDTGKIIGFFSWEKVVYVNSLVIFKGFENNFCLKKIISILNKKNLDSDTVYWKNRKKAIVKMFKLRRF